MRKFKFQDFPKLFFKNQFWTFIFVHFEKSENSFEKTVFEKAVGLNGLVCKKNNFIFVIIIIFKEKTLKKCPVTNTAN